MITSLHVTDAEHCDEFILDDIVLLFDFTSLISIANSALKRIWRHFDEILITGLTWSCQNDNLMMTIQ